MSGRRTHYYPPWGFGTDRRLGMAVRLRFQLDEADGEIARLRGMLDDVRRTGRLPAADWP